METLFVKHVNVKGGEVSVSRQDFVQKLMSAVLTA